MKVKTPKNSPIAVLYSAAKEIVDGTRQVFTRQGQDAQEIRLPILIHGTGMRITIEDGPRVAARNAIEEAQSKVTGKPVKPTVDVTKVLDEARYLLGVYAVEIKDSRRFDQAAWDAGCQDQKTHDRILAALVGLNELERLI